MNRDTLRAVTGIVAIVGGIAIVVMAGHLLAAKRLGEGEFTAFALLAREILGWGANVMRNQFPGPEIDVPVPPKEARP